MTSAAPGTTIVDCPIRTADIDSPRLTPPLENRRRALIGFGLLFALYVIQSRLLREPDLGFVEIDPDLDLRQLFETSTIALIAGYVIWRLPRLRLQINATTFVFFTYIAWMFLSVTWSYSPALTALRALEFTVVTLLILDLITAYEDPLDGMLALALVWIAMAITTLIGAALIWNPPNVYEATRSTSDGFVTAFVIGALSTRRWPFAKTLGILGILVIALAFYRSIGSLVAAAAVAYLTVSILYAESLVGRRLAAIAFGALFLVFTIGMLIPIADNLVFALGRLLDRELGSLTSLTGRTDIWAIVTAKLSEEPRILLIGGGHVAGDRVMVFDWLRNAVAETLAAGEHDYGLASHTHNLVLGMIANVGLVGCVLLITLYFIAPTIALSRHGRPQDLTLVVLCQVFILINGISENILSHTNLLSTGLLAFILAATCNQRGRPGDSRSADS